MNARGNDKEKEHAEGSGHEHGSNGAVEHEHVADDGSVHTHAHHLDGKLEDHTGTADHHTEAEIAAMEPPATGTERRVDSGAVRRPQEDPDRPGVHQPTYGFAQRMQPSEEQEPLEGDQPLRAREAPADAMDDPSGGERDTRHR